MLRRGSGLKDPSNPPTGKIESALFRRRSGRKRIWANAFLVFLSWATPPINSFGLDPGKRLTQYSHRVWSIDEGLPQNSVQAVTQTQDGYLWLGTQEGLVRFDGIRFTVFDEKNVQALRSHHVLSLCEDRDRSLWIGTRGGGLVHFKDGLFNSYTVKDGLPNDIVWSLYVDRLGRLWIGTAGGLARFDNGRFTVAYTASQSEGQNVVMAITEADGALWFGTDGGGLHRLGDGKIQKWTRADGLSSDMVRSLYTDRDGSLWVGTRGGGLNHYKSGRFRTYPTRRGVWDTIGRGAILRDRGGNLWAGTRGGGLLRLRNGEFDALTKKDGLSGDVVMCVYEDREGNLWVGTELEGLNRLKDGKFTPYSTAEGLSHDVVMPILEDRQGNVWMGSYGGGLNRLRNGEFSSYTTRDGLSNNLVVSLSEDRQGNLWIGTDGGGLNRLRDGKFTRFGTREGLSNDRVLAIHEDRERSLWIGTYGGGLNLLRNGRVTHYGSKEGLSNNFVMAITEDREGTLWIGTDGGGVSRFRDGRFTSLTTRQGLSHDAVSRIYEDQEGTVWIGTYGGLNRLRNGKLTSVTRKDGLYDSRIFQILEDGRGNLWMSCSKGIFRVSKEELNDFADGRIRAVTSVAYGKADGMKSSECNGGAQPAGWRTRDGRLWFPTTRGAVTVDPNNLKINEREPPVTIEKVVIDKRPFDPVAGLRVPPGRGEIEFHYTGLSFLDPEKVRFRYLLEGYDQTWVDAGTRRVAYYTNIAPGAYRFRVIASNNDGIWNRTGAAVAFSLAPRFRQTFWFYALCALAMVLLAWALYQIRIRSLHARFSAVLAERNRMAREIHDTIAQGLAAISLQLESVVETLPDSLQLATQHLDRARTLVRGSLDEARRFVSGLRPRALESGDLGTALTEVARHVSPGNPVEIEVHGGRRRLPGLVENNLLRIGQEAITNAVAHSQARRICVTLRFDMHSVELRVQDDGRGFAPETAPLENPGHFGLIGMRERTEMLGGELTLNSSPGRGTEVLVTVPLGGTANQGRAQANV